MEKSRVTPYQGMDDYMVCSFASADRERVQPILERLSREGFRLWYDEESADCPGVPEEWKAARIQGCSLYAVFLSNHFMNSVSCRKALDFALCFNRKQLLCICLEELPAASALELQLGSGVNRIDFSSEEEFYRKLLRYAEFSVFREEEKLSVVPPCSEPPQPEAASCYAPSRFCSFCGTPIREGFRFCSGCGRELSSSEASAPIRVSCAAAASPGQAPSYQASRGGKGPSFRGAPRKKLALSQAEFSALAPKQFTKGEYSMVELALYEKEYRQVVEKIIKNAEAEVKEAVGSVLTLEENTAVRILLSSPDLPLPDCDETQLWRGRYLTFSFPVELPADYAKKQILFAATVYFNGVIATRLKFIAKCSSWRQQKMELLREDVLSGFISYASQDRARVATVIQGMKKARPDMDLFFDVESIRSGEDWQRILRAEIEKRDVLFLCWSEHAKQSKWVEAEWRYALSQKGPEGIDPIPLVSPAECPPPQELSTMHFNDKALLYQE